MLNILGIYNFLTCKSEVLFVPESECKGTDFYETGKRLHEKHFKKVNIYAKLYNITQRISGNENFFKITMSRNTQNIGLNKR